MFVWHTYCTMWRKRLNYENIDRKRHYLSCDSCCHTLNIGSGVAARIGNITHTQRLGLHIPQGERVGGGDARITTIVTHNTLHAALGRMVHKVEQDKTACYWLYYISCKRYRLDILTKPHRVDYNGRYNGHWRRNHNTSINRIHRRLLYGRLSCWATWHKLGRE